MLNSPLSSLRLSIPSESCKHPNKFHNEIRVQSTMAVNCLSRSRASLVLILLLTPLLHLSYEPQKLLSDGNMFVALKLNATLFPGRKSGLPRHSTGLASSPSWKLQASFYMANISLSASYLVLLAGDVSSNPGPVKDPCVICCKGCRSNQKALFNATDARNGTTLNV